jgi:uncharacterized protein with PIN domain
MSSREKARERLLAAAEHRIDELMAWADTTERPTLTDIEDVVLRLRKELGEQMAAEVVAMQEENRPVPGPECPQCGKEMRYKGEKRSSVESRVGSLRLERGYYHCPRCGKGSFPPGQATRSEGEELE